MIAFFVQHASSFLVIGLASLGALLLRAAALAYAKREDENP